MSNAQQVQRQKASAVKRAESQARGFSGAYLRLPSGCSLWSPEKEGIKRIRILPYIVGKGNPNADEGFLFYERTFWIYANIGPNNDKIIAAAKSCNAKDPIAEQAQRYLAEGKKDMLKAIRPKERQLFNILDMENKAAGVQVFEYSNFGFGELLDERVRSRPDKFQDFWDAQNGMVLEVTFKNENVGDGGKFLKAVIIDFEKGDPLPEEPVLTKTYCLDNMIEPLPYEKMYKLYFQEDFDANETGSGNGQQKEQAPWDAPAQTADPFAAKPHQQATQEQAPQNVPAQQQQKPADPWLAPQTKGDDGWGASSPQTTQTTAQPTQQALTVATQQPTTTQQQPQQEQAKPAADWSSW